MPQYYLKGLRDNLYTQLIWNAALSLGVMGKEAKCLNIGMAS